jgi:hypothetical protein
MISLLIMATSPGAFAAADAPAEAKKTLQGAEWELQTLGITDEQARQGLRDLARRRPVTMAIVGEGGVSRSLLVPVLVQGNTLEYRDGATDLLTNTHDTGQVRVIFDLTLQLGVQVRLLVYQPPDDYAVIGEVFARAAQEADLVVCFHSFWGEAVAPMAEKVRQSPTALFVAPYGEFEARPTGTSWQAQAARPGGGGIPHFVTCIPLACRSPGELLRPAARDANDTETINFVAPSFYANGTGGTCPAAATTAAVAAFVFAARLRKPTPAEVVQLLRETASVDRAALTSVAEIDEETMKRLEGEIARLTDPAQGAGQRKLDAAGVLNLREIYRRLAASDER